MQLHCEWFVRCSLGYSLDESAQSLAWKGLDVGVIPFPDRWHAGQQHHDGPHDSHSEIPLREIIESVASIVSMICLPNGA